MRVVSYPILSYIHTFTVGKLVLLLLRSFPRLLCPLRPHARLFHCWSFGRMRSVWCRQPERERERMENSFFLISGSSFSRISILFFSSPFSCFLFFLYISPLDQDSVVVVVDLYIHCMYIYVFSIV